MSMKRQSYLKNERDRHLDELKQLIRLQSVSAHSSRKPVMRQTAEWLAEAMRRAGLQHVEVMETDGHPVVYGDWLEAEGMPTALIYGHYDVQPGEPFDLWQSPPFEPEVRDHKLYGRGATDDKSQMFMHVKTAEAFLQTSGRLPINVKFCIEGEEEIGSPNLARFLERHRQKFQADLVMISDGPMFSEDQPSICCGLRGLCALELEVRGAKSDLHSGLFGGGVVNPVFALAELLATMRGKDGKVSIEGFYEGVHLITETEQQSIASLPFDRAEKAKELGVPELFGEEGYSFIEQTSVRPTLEINGIYGGYQGEDIKTIIPSAAIAKLSCRLVDQQDPNRVLDLIEDHIRNHTPRGVTVHVRKLNGGKPFYISPDHVYMRKAAIAYETGFGKSPVFIRSGGSIPIVETLSGLLGAPVIMMDFGLPDENLHAPNEHFHLDNFDKGIRALCCFMEELSKAD